jgi:cell division protein ZapA (FtsZ GTPase activity inhibitor)
MKKKIEVTILNQQYLFVGEDEEKVRAVAQYVDGRIKDVAREFSIVNTMNAVIMTMMKMTDEYFDMKEKVEKIENSTKRLLQKVDEFNIPCGVRDKW